MGNYLDDYYIWLLGFIDNQDYPDSEFSMILENLYFTTYLWKLPQDSNRAEDGLALRDSYYRESGVRTQFEHLEGNCSVLEMMIALSYRCENEIMCDPYGDNRTWYWFWRMINSLGLEECTDDRFDIDIFNRIINDFMSNQYCRDGKGGLFTVMNPRKDMRKTEIWYQMCWYLDENYSFDI